MRRVVLLTILTLALGASAGSAALDVGGSPNSLEDLRALQSAIRDGAERAMPAVVGVRVGMAQGSGVIVSEGGLVLTAAHVSGDADRDATVILHDGRRVAARTLGHNRGLDAGMLRIAEPGPWPAATLGRSADLVRGQWTLALGHPGGWRDDRPAVLRIGRVQSVGEMGIRSDNPLVGGDSGGGLFDLQGRLVGIHSRIGWSVERNVHVPVDAFTRSWDRLLSGEQWFEVPYLRRVGGPMLGLAAEDADGGCRVLSVAEGGPGAAAGVEVGDLIAAVNGIAIRDLAHLSEIISARPAGQVVTLRVLRGHEPRDIEVTLRARRMAGRSR